MQVFVASLNGDGLFMGVRFVLVMVVIITFPIWPTVAGSPNTAGMVDISAIGVPSVRRL